MNLRRLRNVLAFFAGLLAASAVAERLLPPLEVPQVREKLAWLERHKDEYDIVFVGSSRVRAHLSPTVFDATMQARGQAVRSYNLGIDALAYPEQAYLVERLLALHPARLRLVVLEVRPLRRVFAQWMEPETLRSIYWHDFTHTLAACRAVCHDPRGGERSAWATADLVRQHLWAMGLYYTHLGRGALLATHAPKAAAPLPAGEEERGFFPHPEQLDPVASQAFLDKVAARKNERLRPAPPDPELDRALAATAKKIERTGARVAFLVSPATKGMAEDATPAGRPVFDFNDPVRFPSLYAPEHRCDEQHLNTEGAREYTALVADAVASELGRKP